MTDDTALLADLARLVPADRLIVDPLRRLAYGTDASFYRLVPRVVVKAASEAEVIAVLAACRRHGAAITFRAAGTSLSGQAVTDSVLLITTEGWSRIIVENEGTRIRLQPGVIGAAANRKLAAFGRKIGPDPASIDSCMIGGIAANNASGMCCGTADNSYQTVQAMRLILADGTLVDSGDAASVAAFRVSHGALLESLAALRRRVRDDTALADRIRHKFAIKNTTGYSLNALIDFDDPLDILQHLMIGSEGTLGFIAEITYRTVPEPPHKASALLLFADVGAACRTVARLQSTPVAAVELMDRAALRSVEDKAGMPPMIRGLAPGVTALLVETQGVDAAQLAARITAIGAVLADANTLFPATFTDDPKEYGAYWKIRKGLFPAVGAVRKVGTTVIIEDVAFPLAHLAAATVDLAALCVAHGYHEAIIFGHALAGNLHFVFTQDFGDPAEVDRYAAFMAAVADLVVDTYDGSLKAEHGTGRNMAPFVEKEWGSKATALMWTIKRLLDPEGLLNPGVVLDTNPHAHLEHLKPLPPADPIVDRCIECGFCEPKCPSHGLTLSPRQRITGWREIARADAAGEDSRALRTLYDYQGIDTCATCGLCATACPVDINTGTLIKSLRRRRRGPWSQRWGRLLARHYGPLLTVTRSSLQGAATFSRFFGPQTLGRLGDVVHRRSGGLLPRAGRALPSRARMTTESRMTAEAGDAGEPVLYFPSCAARVMGPAVDDPESESLPVVTARVLARGGFRVIIPTAIAGACCGQPFESKGLRETADAMAGHVEALLRTEGSLPALTDTSACAHRMTQFLDGRVQLFDLIEFLHDRVLPRLTLTPQSAPVVVHVNCAARHLGLEPKMLALARAAARHVTVPEGIGCCGFAGDLGFTTPALNQHALRDLATQIPRDCEAGYSSNRTCEIGLADRTGVPYRSIVYLLDRASR